MNKTLNILPYSDEVEWIFESVNKNSAVSRVDAIIPFGYDFYFKIFFPAGLLQENKTEPTQKTYKEIAAHYGLNYSGDFTMSSLLIAFRNLPADFVIMKEKDEELVSEFIQLIGKDVPCVFHGFGDDLVPDEFQAAWVMTANFSKLSKIFKSLNRNNWMECNFFPEYIFPLDRSWCMGTKIFQGGFFLLGCNAATAGKLRSQKTIDFTELLPSDEYIEFMK